MKVQVNNNVIEIRENYIIVRDGRLWNKNTGNNEGIDGDVVEYKIGGAKYKGHVVGYTDHQFVTTKEWGAVVLSSDSARFVKYTHNNKVTIV